MDQHTGEWLIHGTKRHMDNQLQSWELPFKLSLCKHDIKESKGNMINPSFKGNIQRRKHPGGFAFAETELLSYRKPKV